MCINIKKVNEITITDTYPMPLINELLDQVGHAKFFSSLDAFARFHAIPLHPDSIPKTSFVLQWGQWEYIRMPFGLKNAPAIFQRMMNTILASVIGRCAVVYVDNINVYSNTFEEHLQYLEEIFELIKNAGLRLNTKKCHFGKQKLNFLGFIVSVEGTHTDPRKVEKVKNFPSPKTSKQAISFLMLASYYRRFVKDFAKRSASIQLTLKKEAKQFFWGPAQEAAFNDLKKALTEAPVVIRPDFTRRFILATDASGAGLGAVLSQHDDQKRERVIEYASKATNKTQSDYDATQLESLAVI